MRAIALAILTLDNSLGLFALQQFSGPSVATTPIYVASLLAGTVLWGSTLYCIWKGL